MLGMKRWYPGCLGAILVVGAVAFGMWRRQAQELRDQMRLVQDVPKSGLQQALNEVTNVKIVLRHAAERGDWGPIEKALAQGVTPDDDIDGRTLLMIAAQNGQTDLVRRLCARGSKVDAANVHGNRALMYAARFGQAGATRFLLEHGANIKAANERKLTALDMAIAGRETETYALLRDHGAAVNLAQALQMKDEPRAKELMDHGADGNRLCPTVRFGVPVADVAALSGPHSNVVESSPRPKEGHTELSPLMAALESGWLEMAETLVRHGANINQREHFADGWGMTPLENAVFKGDVPTVRFLMRHGARVDNGIMLYAKSAEKNKAEINDLLLQVQTHGD